MDEELRSLIDSPEFAQYHESLQEREKKFNLFDVLRNAHYEIRHSNVVAWLLDPNETHGLGDRFLRRFVQRVDPVRVGLRPNFSTEDVTVEREHFYVDVVIFLNDERRLIAIENKVVEMYEGAVTQATDYEQTLRKEYGGRYGEIHSVLLTASSEEDAVSAIAAARPVAPLPHVSWQGVHEIIEGFYPDAFADDDVRSFMGQYLDAVRSFTQPGHGGDAFEELIKNRHATLKRLSETNGQSAIGEVDDEQRRRSLELLIGTFRQRPREQREEVRNYLKRRGIDDTQIASRGAAYWLNWGNAAWTGSDVYLNWSIEFTSGAVTLTLYSPPFTDKPLVRENIISFLQRTPIDPSQPPGKSSKYPMDYAWNYLTIYRHTLLGAGDLAKLSFQETAKQLCQKLDEWFNGPDYERIETYFKCLAHDPNAPAPEPAARR